MTEKLVSCVRCGQEEPESLAHRFADDWVCSDCWNEPKETVRFGAESITDELDRITDIFPRMLQLLRLEAKRFGLMLQLFESLAVKAAKEACAPEALTIEQYENLMDYVPWDFGSSPPRRLRSRQRVLNRVKYNQLKEHVKGIATILESVTIRGEEGDR